VECLSETEYQRDKYSDITDASATHQRTYVMQLLLRY